MLAFDLTFCHVTPKYIITLELTDHVVTPLFQLGVLREIAWTRSLRAECPTLRWYYMGYYIHTCPKMRYKAEYAPSELRCPVTGRWVGIDEPGVVAALEDDAFRPLDRRCRALKETNDEDEPETTTNPGDATATATALVASNDDAAIDATIIGVVSGRELAQLAPLGMVARSLPQPPARRLREKVRAWRRACGPAGDGIAYLSQMDHLLLDGYEYGSDDDDDEEGEEEEEDMDAE